jgi:hypothetical protein
MATIQFWSDQLVDFDPEKDRSIPLEATILGTVLGQLNTTSGLLKENPVIRYVQIPKSDSVSYKIDRPKSKTFRGVSIE